MPLISIGFRKKSPAPMTPPDGVAAGCCGLFFGLGRRGRSRWREGVLQRLVDLAVGGSSRSSSDVMAIGSLAGKGLQQRLVEFALELVFFQVGMPGRTRVPMVGLRGGFMAVS